MFSCVVWVSYQFPDAAAALARITGIEELTVEGNAVKFRTRDATPTLAAVTRFLVEQQADLQELQVRKATLEDVFLGLTREHGIEGEE